MAHIAFTPHLRAVGPVRRTACEAASLAEALDGLAGDYPRLKDYVLDAQGRLRKHIAVFIDGALVARETALAVPLTASSDIYVFQALSGG